MRKISISIPTYNRYEMLFESFESVHEDNRISDVTIVDDSSSWDIYEQVKVMSECFSKVKLFRNDINKDCYQNKRTAISFAKNEWSVLLDSDNRICVDYIDKIYEYDWDIHTIYAPDFAMPAFCYERFSGLEITKDNVSAYMDEPMFEVCLNTCNFFIHRDTYLEVWDGSVDPVTSDSIYFCLKWLEAGFKIKIVNGLRYQHRIHDNSHYNSNKNRTPDGFHQSILNRLKQMV